MGAGFAFRAQPLREYEQELCRRWPNQLGGLRQYNESLFANDVVDPMAECHCVVVRDGNIVRHHPHGPASTEFVANAAVMAIDHRSKRELA